MQRVTEASVTENDSATGDPVTLGSIGRGLLVLAAFAPGDGDEQLAWMADRLWGLRVFPDDEGRMNVSTRAAGGSLLLVSQFTLYGDCSRGRRPSFQGAAPPGRASALYHRFVDTCREGGHVEVGRFGAMMTVKLRNDGPVTLLIDR